MGVTSILAIVAEIAKIVQIIFSRTNSPDMVHNALDNIQQNLADQSAALDQKLSQPNLSAVEHQKAIDQLRLEQS